MFEKLNNAFIHNYRHDAISINILIQSEWNSETRLFMQTIEVTQISSCVQVLESNRKVWDEVLSADDLSLAACGDSVVVTRSCSTVVTHSLPQRRHTFICIHTSSKHTSLLALFDVTSWTANSHCQFFFRKYLSII